MRVEPRSHAAPAFLYGTAWKEERTQELTELAIRTGFRGIDTANQRKHYFEAAVGAAVARMIEDQVVRREDLFLQTKFTFAAGQDHRLPYDAAAETATQVAQSFASSLDHLGTSYVDCYVLHGPSARSGLARADWDAWRAMERIARSGAARRLGVSNVSVAQLRSLFEGAEIKPAFVQNRCYARTGWDREARAFCADRGIVYQGFSLLTANARELGGRAIQEIAARIGRSVPQVVFGFALQIGILPLTGTSRVEHMRADLTSQEIELDRKDMDAIENVSF